MEFVTRKIAAGAARIKRGKDVRPIPLEHFSPSRLGVRGRLTGDASHVVCGHPQDYVIATGQSWSVADFAERAFNYVGLDWQNHVELTPLFAVQQKCRRSVGMRPRQRLNWAGNLWLTSDQLVHRMVDWELRRQAV